jgi:hypothetical protein
VHSTNTHCLLFLILLCVIVDCTLSLQELYDAIVALRPTFLIALVTLSLGGLLLPMLCLDDRLQ